MPPRRQQMNIWKGFHPYPEQRTFLTAPEKYRLVSSGYGSGKSSLGCRETLRHCIQYPGSRNMIGRLELKRLKKTTQVTLHEQMRRIGLKRGTHYKYNSHDEEYHFKNGSMILLTQLDDEEFFGSLEVSTIFLDEGSEIPDNVYDILFPSRLRWHLPGCDYHAIEDPEAVRSAKCACPHRGWVCTNPGASGYLHKVVDGFFNDWKWVPIPPGANPFVGKEYHRELAEKGKLRGEHWYKRYVEGSWDAFEGQRFPMFDENIHVFTDPGWKPQENHTIFEGWDFGYANPTSVQWIAVDREKDTPAVVFDEYHMELQEVGDIAAAIKSRRAKWGLVDHQIQSYVDPGGLQKQAGTGVSAIHLYNQGYGLNLSPCHIGKSPHARADLIAELLNKRVRTQAGLVPALMVHQRCENLRRGLKTYRYEPSDGKGNVSENFVKDDDHDVDALGYGLISAGLDSLGEYSRIGTASDDIARQPGDPNDVLRPSASPTPDDLFRRQEKPPEQELDEFEQLHKITFGTPHE